MNDRWTRWAGAAVVTGALAGLASAGPALAQSKSDVSFVKKAIEGNLAEVQLGQLAQQKASSRQVRDVGTMLVKDHSDNNQQAMALAQALKVTPPSAPSSAQKKTYDRLSKLSGDKFDREFARNMVSDHRKDIREFQSEAKSKNQQVAAYANATLPHLQDHLKAAESLTQTAQAPSGTPPNGTPMDGTATGGAPQPR